MSTVSQMQFVAPVQLGAADAALYTVPANTTAKIGRAVFTNTTAGALTITAGITSGGALTAGNTLISGLSIAAGASYVSPELAGAVMPAGSQIHAYASVAASITCTASGLTIV